MAFGDAVMRRYLVLLVGTLCLAGVGSGFAQSTSPEIQSLEIEGNRWSEKSLILSLSGLSEHEPLTSERAQRAVRQLYALGIFRDVRLLARIRPEMVPLEDGGKASLTFHISEGKKVQVKHIEILGNAAFGDGKIEKQMETREDRWWRSADFQEDVFEEDRDRILAFYRTHGYRYARIVRDSLYYDESREHLFIEIVLEEGPQYRFGAFSWEGNRAFSDMHLADLVTVSEGDVYNEEELARIYNSFLTAYQEEGHLNTSIHPHEEETGEHVVDIRFTIREGGTSEINRVKVAGNTKTREEVIRRELTLLPGEPFQQSVLGRSLRNVYALNFFEDVRHDVELLPSGDREGY